MAVDKRPEVDDDLLAHVDAALERRRAHMRQKHDLVPGGELEQLGIERRLVFVDVEAGAGDLAVLDQLDQRFFIDDVSARRLQLMKPTSYLVNTARGEIIDEAALARMLEKGELAGAGLDVFEHEPAINPKLKKLANVVLLPHMGSATLEGRIDMGEKVVINIRTFFDGHRPPDRVLPSRV